MKKTILSLLTGAVTATSLAAGNPINENQGTTSQTYVLVHGAWQASYVWDAVKVDLTQKGNKVIVVELPGQGTDNTAAYTLSIDVYRDKVIEAISAVSEKVILAGHSMGGVVISAVAEKVPSKISKLVYIGAFLPANGQALTDLAYSDPDSKLGPLLRPSTDKLTLDIKADSLTYLFINEGDAAIKQQVVENYRAEPAIPFTNRVRLSNENFGRVSKVYIKTLQDIVISPGLQERMIAAAGIKQIYSLNSSHSPFLSQPHAVSELLQQVGK